MVVATRGGRPMPKWITALFLAALLLPAGAPAADADPEPPARAVKPREVVVRTRLAGGVGNVIAPLRIRSARALAELLVNEEARAALLKQVDFKKEHLLLFSWSGSGGDRLTAAESKAGEANFEFSAGFTDDLRRHAKLFAIPAKAKVKITNRKQ
jgi:hypothetical protein